MKGSTIFVLLMLIVMCASYLEIALIKHELKKELHHKGDPICITK